MARNVDFLSEVTKKKVNEYKEAHKDCAYASELKRKSKKKGGPVSFNELSKEAMSYTAKLGAIASAEKRRNTIILSDTMKMLMEMPLPKEDEIRKILQAKGLDSEILTEATAICYMQLQRAKADSKAFEVVRDTIGQKPVDKQVVVANVESSADIIKNHFGE